MGSCEPRLDCFTVTISRVDYIIHDKVVIDTIRKPVIIEELCEMTMCQVEKYCRERVIDETEKYVIAYRIDGIIYPYYWVNIKQFCYFKYSL